MSTSGQRRFWQTLETLWPVESHLVLQAFCIFTARDLDSFFCFAGSLLALASLIFWSDTQTFTNAEQCFGYSRHFHNWRRVTSMFWIYFTVSLASLHAKASLWLMQWLHTMMLHTFWSLAPTPLFLPVMTLAPSEPKPQTKTTGLDHRLSAPQWWSLWESQNLLNIFYLQKMKMFLPFLINITNIDQQLL